MKKIISILTLSMFAFSWALLIPFPKIHRAHAEDVTRTLIITEVASTVASDEEWVEVFNSGTEALAISDLVFFENNTNHGVTSFTGETQIAAGAVAIIANKAEVFKSKNPSYVGMLLDSSWSSLLEAGEPIGLKVKGVFVDQVTYGLSVSNETTERASLENEWRAGVHTMGELSESQRGFLVPATATTPVETTAEEEAKVEPTLTENTPIVNEEEPAPTEQDTEAPPTTTNATTTTPTTAIPQSTESAASTTTEQASLSSSTTSYTQIVTNAPPIARIIVQSGQLTAAEKVSVNLDGRTSYDPNNDALHFDWDFGDDTKATSANPGIHSYTKVGIYSIQLTVTDMTGLKGVAYLQAQVLAKPSAATTSTTGAQSASSTEKITITVTPEQAKALFDTYSSSSTSRETNIVASTAGITAEATESETSPRGVVLNEIFPAPEKGNTEWIELYNTEASAQNLSGLLLADSSKLKKPFVFPAGSVIPPHGFAVIAGDQSKISLNNSEDSVFLASPSGTLLDSVKYTGGKKGTSYARATDEGKTSWSWTTETTRGKSNPSVATLTGTVKKVGTKTKNGKSVPIIEIQTADNEIHTVEADASDGDADITSGFFDEGSTVTVAAFEAEDGSEHLSSVKNIEQKSDAVLSESANEQQQAAVSYTPLIIGAVLVIAINTLTIVYFVRGFGPRRSASEFVQDPLESVQ